MSRNASNAAGVSPARVGWPLPQIYAETAVAVKRSGRDDLQWAVGFR